MIDALLDEPLRFGELETALAGISPNILSARLKRLEQDGIVLATPYQDRPTRYVYELTAAGRELSAAVSLLADWGARYAGEDDPEAIRHEVCGTRAEARWWCPTCGVPLDDDANLQQL